MRKSLKISLVVIFILSITLNLLIVSYFLPTYGINDFFIKFIQKNKIDNSEFIEPSLPLIYTQNKLSLSFSKNVESEKDFTQWKAQVQNKLEELLGFSLYDVSQYPLNLEFLEENETYTKYSLSAIDGEKIIFYELLPQNLSEPFSTVLVIPGSGNQGAKDVLGLSSEFSQYYYHKGIANDLLKSGYAVYVIENRGWGERTIDVGTFCQGVTADRLYCSGALLSSQLSNYGYDLHSLQIRDTIQVLNFIKSLDYIKNDEISMIGISLGGYISMIVSVLDSELQSTILASGLTNYQNSWTEGSDGMLEYFDSSDLMSTLIPNPIYLSWGTEELYPWDREAKTLKTAKKIESAYSKFNSEENIMIVVHNDNFNSGHTFDKESIINFLNDLK